MGGTLIPRRVVEKVELVVVLRIEPLPSLGDLSDDLRPAGVEVFLLHLLCYPLGDLLLGRRVVEDGRAILYRGMELRFDDNETRRGSLTSPTVVPLLVESRRIMCPVEEFWYHDPMSAPQVQAVKDHHRALTNELSVSHYIWIKLDPQSLSVVRRARTNLLVVWIVGATPGVPDGGLEDPLVLGRGVVL